MKAPATAGRFAERIVDGRDDGGRSERVVIWIERRPGAIWSVGRAIDPKSHPVVAPRNEHFVFEGYEMGDALEAANNALSDDLRVSSGDGLNEDVEPFVEDELLKPLERWFFGHPLH